MKNFEIDIGEIFFAAVVIWMMIKGELMAVIALCAFAAVTELSRIRKQIKKNAETRDKSRDDQYAAYIKHAAYGSKWGKSISSND